MSAEDCSLQTRNLSSKEQIWLPGLQVWAAVGSMRADTSANCGKNPRSVVVAGPSASVNIQTKAEVPLVTEAPVKAATLASDASTCVTQEAEIVPTCPICLMDITSLSDKAVVNSCMHVFCVECISRWAARKRVCPLCKGRIHGYLYNIQNDTDFSERIISPSPERQSSPPYHPPRASRWGPNPSAALSYLDSFAPPSHSANPSQSHSEHLQRWHNTAQHYFGNSSQQLNSGSGNSTTIRPSHSSRHQASNSAAASREPRPYYYRVQQQMQAGLANHGQHRGPSRQAAPEDASMTWRRNIYADNMWAVTSGPQASAMPSLTSQALNRPHRFFGQEGCLGPRTRRLQDWVNRELQALLDQQDVSIVRSFVMSLASSHGLDRQQGVLSQSGASSASLATTLNALKPFLHERTDHFWHEMRCFAESPYSMAAYDRVAQYQRRIPEGSQLVQQDQRPQQPQGFQQPQHAQQLLSWALPGQSNAPPALPRAPGARLRPPHNATIDLTADSDASPSPSSSSDYQILSVDPPASGPADLQRERTQVSSPAAALVEESSNPCWLQAAANARPDPHRASDQQDQISSRLSNASAGARSWPAQHCVAQNGKQHDIVAVGGAWNSDATVYRQTLRPARRRRWDVTPEEMPSIDSSAAQGSRGRSQAPHQGQESQLETSQPSGAIEHTPGGAAEAQLPLSLKQGCPAHAGPSSADMEGSRSSQGASAVARRHRKKHRKSHTPTDWLDARGNNQRKRRHRLGSSSRSRSRARSGVRDGHRHERDYRQSRNLKKRNDDGPDADAASCDLRHGELACKQPNSCNQSELQSLDLYATSAAAACVNGQHAEAASERWQLWQPGMDL